MKTLILISLSIMLFLGSCTKEDIDKYYVYTVHCQIYNINHSTLVNRDINIDIKSNHEPVDIEIKNKIDETLIYKIHSPIEVIMSYTYEKTN